MTSRPPADVFRHHPRGACSWRRQVLGRVLEAGGPDTGGQTDVKRSVPEGARGGREGTCKQRSRRGCAGDSVGMMLAVLCPGGEAAGELHQEQELGGFGSGGRSARAHLPGPVPDCAGRVRVRAHEVVGREAQRGIYPANSRRKATEGSELYYTGGIDHVTKKVPRTHAYSYCDAIPGT